MRILLIVLATAAIALPASAAGVDPQALVIARSDVPSGFRADPKKTGIRSNELEATEFPETRTKFQRWRRVTGYQARYQHGSGVIEARVDLFRGADGAHELLGWVDLELRKAGVKGQTRVRSDIGMEGWVHSVGFTLVVWRQGRVFAAVMGRGISRAETLALARAQQRRMVAGL